MRSGLSGRRRKKNRENEYGVCCCFLKNEYGDGNSFLGIRNIFRFMASMSRFFTKKPRGVFGGFSRRAKQEDGGFWTSRFRWSSCLGENAGGRGVSSCTRERSNALVPIFAHGVGVSLGGSGAVSMVNLPRR